MTLKYKATEPIDAEVILKPNMKIIDIIDDFKSVFGLTLTFNTESKNTNSDLKFQRNSTTTQKLKAYEKIGDVEEKIRDFTGYEVHVTSLSEHYKLDTELRLAEASKRYRIEKV